MSEPLAVDKQTGEHDEDDGSSDRAEDHQPHRHLLSRLYSTQTHDHTSADAFSSVQQHGDRCEQVQSGKVDVLSDVLLVSLLRLHADIFCKVYSHHKQQDL